jgi:hypothetical protein
MHLAPAKALDQGPLIRLCLPIGCDGVDQLEQTLAGFYEFGRVP